jgi:hypothetical protein
MDIAAGCLVFSCSDVRGLEREPRENLTDRAGTLPATRTRVHAYTYTPMTTEFDIAISTITLHLKNHWEKPALKSRSQAMAIHHAHERSGYLQSIQCRLAEYRR